MCRPLHHEVSIHIPPQSQQPAREPQREVIDPTPITIATALMWLTPTPLSLSLGASSIGCKIFSWLRGGEKCLSGYILSEIGSACLELTLYSGIFTLLSEFEHSD
ncbi:MAG: hypothetical protein MRY21_03415 [Simkaniaceae bacterium]|nr:hypothetical protein [Simkaniaceae bacterium]